MSYNITLYNFSKRKNETKRPSGTGLSIEIQGLKHDTSALTPSFVVSGSHLSSINDYNYAVWGSNYYYITDVVQLRNNLTEIKCRRDPMATFKGSIGIYPGFCLRSSSGYDLDIEDNQCLAINKVIKGNQITQNLTTNGVQWSFNSAWTTTVLVTYGKGGVQGFACQGSPQLVVDELLDDGANSNIWDVTKSIVYDPSKYLVSCMILPYRPSGTYTDVTAWLGNADRPLSLANPITDGSDRKSNAEVTFATSTIISDLEYTDFRAYNNAYTELVLYLPFAGKIEIDPYYLSYEAIAVKYTIDDLTGCGEVLIRASSTDLTVKDVCIAKLNVNVGAEVPITASRSNQQLVTNDLIKLDLKSLFVDNAFGRSEQTMVGTNGSVGVWDVGTVYLFWNQKESIARDYTDTKGIPCMKQATPSSFASGTYLEYLNPSVTVNCFDSERDEINGYLSNGFYYN